MTVCVCLKKVFDQMFVKLAHLPDMVNVNVTYPMI